MSIKEALERAKPPRERPKEYGSDNDYIEFNPYKEIAEKNCRKVIKETKISAILADFEDTIKGNYPDVEIDDFKLNSELAMSAKVTWNRKATYEDNWKCSFFTITIRPKIERVEIRSFDSVDLIFKNEWKGHPEVIEEAIVKAYNNPHEMLVGGWKISERFKG